MHQSENGLYTANWSTRLISVSFSYTAPEQQGLVFIVGMNVYHTGSECKTIKISLSLTIVFTINILRIQSFSGKLSEEFDFNLDFRGKKNKGSS